MSNKPVRITETAFRDAHQSLLATRMRTADMLPIATRMNEVGYHSVEMWGGATFDSAMRFLNEDPWERISLLKARMPDTPFQMLLRGQNIVGYRNYPDDILEKFIICSIRRGISVFRIFDALNDTRNMRHAMEVVKREGGYVQAAICYTISPVHTVEGFAELGKELASMGADSICIKDMAGLLSPVAAYELVSKLKATLDLPIQVHTHYTSGMGSAAYVKAAEAGADVLDTAISSMALATSQPPTESIVAMLRDTPRDTGLDLGILSDISAYFAEVRGRYADYESGFQGVDVRVLRYQIPGGMLSNLVAQLREQGAEDRYEEVLKEIPRVRAELGYPPLVTPTSQIVGTQATLNVLTGERYKLVTQETKNLVKGMYGRTPAPIDPEIKKLVIGDEEPIDCRPADLLEPGFEKAKAEIGDLARSDEDVLSYALFPQVARPFLERRAKGEVPPIDQPTAKKESPKVEAARAATPAGSAPAPRKVYSLSMWKLAGRLGRG